MPWICGLCGSSARFAFCVVLAMYGSPLLRDHTSRQPQPEAKSVTGKRMELEGAMCLMAVQVDGDSGYGDMGHDQRIDDISPPRQIVNSCEHVLVSPF